MVGRASATWARAKAARVAAMEYFMVVGKEGGGSNECAVGERWWWYGRGRETEVWKKGRPLYTVLASAVSGTIAVAEF